MSVFSYIGPGAGLVGGVTQGRDGSARHESMFPSPATLVWAADSYGLAHRQPTSTNFSLEVTNERDDPHPGLMPFCNNKIVHYRHMGNTQAVFLFLDGHVKTMAKGVGHDPKHWEP